VVDDDPDVLFGCEQALQLADMQTLGAESAEKALRLVRGSLPDLVISDIRLPGMDGLVLMREILRIDPELPVVLITGHGDVALAVQAMRDGAYDFVEKPFLPDYLVDVSKRALEKRALILEVRALRHQLQDKDKLSARILGNAPAIEHIRCLVQDLADIHAPLLINGQTGTGKELIARSLHETSARRHGNFVAINCGGLPENLVESELFGHEAGSFTGANKRRIGKIEHANGGTLFLDEIETMPMSVQIKLLRVLQERSIERLGSNLSIPVDCRVVAASKADLGLLSETGRFRADLYYRLNVASVDLPPLSERREDIPLLLENFLQQASVNHGRPAPAMTPAKMQKLMGYAWPGNVRELRNVAERCVLGIEMGFPPFAGPREVAMVSYQQMVEDFECALISDALRRHGNSLSQTSVALQLPKTTLHDKMKKLGLVTIEPRSLRTTHDGHPS
jgi:two-component system C4-dicarboxylate transport response regulator DctD